MPTKFDRKVFFDLVRTSVFKGSLSQGQVDGLNRLLKVWEKYCQTFPERHLAYNLATSYHETGRTMQPIKERGSRSYFNKYDIQHNPRKAKELGNVRPGDGYKFRGEGDVQNTGRRNARFSSQRLNDKFGLNVDFEANPDKRGDPLLSALCLFLGNEEGWWTGKKLSDYPDFRNMRRVVNGTDRAATIAGYAESFERAVKASARTVDAVEPPQTEGNSPMEFIVSRLLPVLLPALGSMLSGLFKGLFPEGMEKGLGGGLRKWVMGLFGLAGVEKAGVANVDLGVLLNPILGALSGQEASGSIGMFATAEPQNVAMTLATAVLGLVFKEHWNVKSKEVAEKQEVAKLSREMEADR